MLSRRVPLLTAFSAVLVLVSIALKDWCPSTLILPITTLIMLTQFLSPKSELNVEVKRKLTQEIVMTGETVTVKLEVTNKSEEKIDFLEVYDMLPAELCLTKGANHLIISLDAKEKMELIYEILCNKRGMHEIGPTFLRTRDPLGFSFNENTQPTTFRLHVLPKIEKLKSGDLPFKRTGQWPGVIHSSRKGAGMEFYGLRDYFPGDDLRRIGWKASARMGKLVTIENESERSTDIVIILDATSDLSLGDNSETLLEYCIRAVGSLASLLLSLGNQVSVISHCTSRIWLPGGFGKRHLRNVLDHLADVEAGETPLPIGFGLDCIFESKPQVILVSPLLAPNIVKDVRSIVSDGYNVLVISPSLSATLSKQADEETKIAFRIFALERRNTITELRRYCTVVDWNPEVPLKTAMKGARKWRI
ncbi:MAG: DUF58 domain-containing protein [Candidatus Bathyarchaeia archaeon]